LFGWVWLCFWSKWLEASKFLRIHCTNSSLVNGEFDLNWLLLSKLSKIPGKTRNLYSIPVVCTALANKQYFDKTVFPNTKKVPTEKKTFELPSREKQTILICFYTNLSIMNT
jgi:hypothetical protein